MNRRRQMPLGLAVTKLALHSSLTAHQKLTLIVIADHLGTNNHSWPSYSTLARLTSLSRRTVITTVKSLADTGILTIRYKTGQRSNSYIPELTEIMNRVCDENLKARIRDRLIGDNSGNGCEALDRLESNEQVMVKRRHQGDEAASLDGKTFAPEIVNGFHQDGESVAPERPRRSAPPRTPK
jgi:DNA-binding GntR family transcriptional regulator